jgi:hypothetical protein
MALNDKSQEVKICNKEIKSFEWVKLNEMDEFL